MAINFKHCPAVWLFLARCRLARALDLGRIPPRHRAVAQLFRQHLPLFEYLDCPRNLAFTQKVTGPPEYLGVTLSFFSRIHDFY